MTDSLQDNAQESTLESVENLTEDSQDKDFFEKIAISQLLQRYKIQRGSLYERMKYLKITTYKDEDEKAYLSAEQLEYMDGLHQHIKEHGRMKGYPIPAPSGPVEEPVESEPVKGDEPQAGIVVSQTQKISKAPNYLPTKVRGECSTEVENLPKVVQNGQNKAAGQLITENMIARGYIESPHLLPEELREAIRQSGEISIIDPFVYAESLMASIRAEGLIGSL